MGNSLRFLSLLLVWVALLPARGETFDCHKDQRRHANTYGLQIDCNHEYLRYASQGGAWYEMGARTVESARVWGGADKGMAKALIPRVRLASFNLYHMGDSLGRYKRYDYVAAIMDQWDLVTALEIMPPGSKEAQQNEDLDTWLAEHTEKRRLQSPFVGPWDLTWGLMKSLEGVASGSPRLFYQLPGYLQLLLALQKRDPAWALLLSPEARGSSVSHRELTGYYYRARVVQPIPMNYCNGAEACLAQFPPGSRHISREPFVARFRSGAFDFAMLGFHARFRVSKDPVDFARALDVFPALELGYRHKLGTSEFSQGSAQEISRFAELTSIVRLMQELRLRDEEQDIILAGDFNLTVNPRRVRAWRYALRGGNFVDQRTGMGDWQVYVNTPTSVSRKNGPLNGYDHFVLSPQATAECVDGEPTAIQLLHSLGQGPQQMGVFAHTSVENLKPLIADFQQPLESVADKVVGDYQTNLAQQYRVERGSLVPAYSAKSLAQETAKLRSRLQPSLNELPKSPFQIYIELMSDHLPIYTSCRTDRDDD